ncbi:MULTISPECIES: HEPN/Toprim-associated domain-containing protein [Chryseobacterium]|uniref:HEPN/Toprim-associated domain-containing protein n=1 Tax=Chryseobacterium TaxID=59732 RepID=UPI0006797992|nr:MULTISPECIES: HEPN/Toprim-associated domain-containing protein [Chryseobacterium]
MVFRTKKTIAMGSMILLSVGNLEVDWGKNNFFNDYNPIFQPDDLTKVPYYYVDEENPMTDGSEEYNLVIELKDGMSKSLSKVIDRINLLGYSFEYACKEFQLITELNDIDLDKFNFDHLLEALTKVDVNVISCDYGEGESFGKFFRRYIFDKLGLEKIIDDPDYGRFQIGEAMENLSAYSILHLLMQNPLAKSLPVNWQFSDVEESGWANRDYFVRELDAEHKFLIVTEGSTDAKILKHAFKLIKPHISDFFTFVDMEEGYPFSGTGNLFNFTKGLISIAVQNDIIILYDNDAEGVFSYNKTKKLKLLNNMKVLRLPDLQAFESFKTVGPDGESFGNINGCGAAIECYLDVGADAMVRWNNYNKELGIYQGELFEKRTHMLRFFDIKDLESSYDISKISAVLELIIKECINLRSAQKINELEENRWKLD